MKRSINSGVVGYQERSVPKKQKVVIVDNSYDSNTTTQSDSENQEYTPIFLSQFIKSFPVSSQKIPDDKYAKLLSIAKTDTKTLSRALYTTILCGKYALLNTLLKDLAHMNPEELKIASAMPYKLEGTTMVLSNLLEAAIHRGVYQTIEILSRHQFNTELHSLISLLHLNTKKQDEPFYIAEILLRKYLETQLPKNFRFEEGLKIIQNNPNYIDEADRTAEQRRLEHLATYQRFEEQIAKAQKRQNVIDNQPMIVLTRADGESSILHQNYKSKVSHIDYCALQATALQKCDRSIQK